MKKFRLASFFKIALPVLLVGGLVGVGSSILISCSNNKLKPNAKNQYRTSDPTNFSEVQSLGYLIKNRFRYPTFEYWNYYTIKSLFDAIEVNKNKTMLAYGPNECFYEYNPKSKYSNFNMNGSITDLPKTIDEPNIPKTTFSYSKVEWVTKPSSPKANSRLIKLILPIGTVIKISGFKISYWSYGNYIKNQTIDKPMYIYDDRLMEDLMYERLKVKHTDPVYCPYISAVCDKRGNEIYKFTSLINEDTFENTVNVIYSHF